MSRKSLGSFVSYCIEILLVVPLASSAVGCAAAPVAQHLEFTGKNVALLHKHMTPAEVTSIFGSPDSIVPNGKEGVVWEEYIYRMGVPDRRYSSGTIEAENVLAFDSFDSGSSKELFSWTLRIIYPDHR